MAIKESMYFSYDGIKSSDMGIINVSVGGGLFEETFLSDREIIQREIRGRTKPYFIDIRYSPITIPLTIMFEENWNDTQIRETARWLSQPYYKELYFSENPSRIFYAMLIDDSNLVHNGSKQGYVNLTFQTNDCYSYSPIYTSNIYDFSSNQINGTEIQIVNSGDVICKPIIYIEKIGNGDISIVNYSNEQKEMKLTALNGSEFIAIDCENETIETNIDNVYRYSNHNRYFLELIRGVNNLRIYGNAKIQFKYQFKTLQG